MPGTSRRKFLYTAGAGAAAAGVAGALPSLAGSPSLEDEVVVEVTNAAKGVFTVYVGERAVEITDKAFAGRVADALAAARATTSSQGA